MSRSTMEANLNIPNLTSSDNGSLLTCKAAQGQMGSFVTTTIKLIEEGNNEMHRLFTLQIFFRVEKQHL